MRKTLLQSLTEALDKIYDGNTMLSNEGKQDGLTHKDMYKCDCGSIVYLEEWNEEYKMCVECYMEVMEEQKIKYGER